MNQNNNNNRIIQNRTLRNRRRRQARRLNRNIAPIIVNVPRRRNRRNRRRNRGGGMNGVTGVDPNTGQTHLQEMLNPLNLSVPEREGVEKLYQTLFFPEHGPFRGLAESGQKTALTTIVGSFDLNQFTATNLTASFAFIPFQTSLSNGLGGYVYTPGFSNPLAGGTTTIIPHPFGTTNPSTDFRVVSFEFRIIPVGALINQGGEGVLSYFTNFSSMADFSYTSINNGDYMLPFNGMTSMIGHWVPNQEEIQMKGANSETQNVNSGFIGYITVPASTATSVGFRVDYTISIEYVPTYQYKLFVEKLNPTTYITSYYHINRMQGELWNPLILGYYKDWLEHKDRYDPKSYGSNVRHLTPFGIASGGDMNNDSDQKYHDIAQNSGLFGKVGAAVAGGLGLLNFRNRLRNRGLGAPAPMMYPDGRVPGMIRPNY